MNLTKLDSNMKHKLMTVFMASIAILGGAVIIYFGQLLLGVNLELYHGIETFSPLWVLNLFVVPIIAGIFVSAVYGLGGKIIAHFPPMFIHIYNYVMLESSGLIPEGSTLLPLGFWILLLIVAVEFCALGGVVGEIIVKKTYGRSNKQNIHKKYQKTGEA